MSTNRSQARRRLGLALAPVVCAAFMANTALAGEAPGDNGYTGPDGVTCQVPSENPIPDLPVCKPNLELNKTGPGVITPGTHQWTITVWHAGYPGAEDPMASDDGVPISAITVDDPDMGLEDLTPDPGSVPKDGMLRPGHALTYTVSQTFDEKLCDDKKKTVSNTATMTVEGVEQSTTADDTHTVTVPVSCTADVGVTKTADRATYAPGDTAQWTVTVKNHGATDVPVARIQVDDVDATLTPAADNPADVLAPGATMTFTAQTAISTEMCAGIKNTVTVVLTGSGPIDGNAGNNTATATADVSCAPPAPTEGGSQPGTTDGAQAGGTQPGGTTTGSSGQSPAICARVSLQAAIRVPKRPFAGARSTVVLRVKARSAARRVTMAYRLPKGFVVTKRPRNVTVRSGIVRVNFGTLRRNRAKGVKLQVRIVRNASGARRHAAVARAYCAPARRAVNQVRLRPVQGPVNPAVTG